MHRQNCMNQPPTMNWYYNHQAGPHHHHQVPYHQGYCGAQGEQMWHHHFHTDLPHELYAGMSQVQVSGYPTGQGVETQLPSPPITVSGSEMSSPGGDASPPIMVNSNGRPTPARSPYEWIKRTNYTTGTSQELLWSGSGISSPSPSEESGETRRGNLTDGDGDGVRWRTSSVEGKTRTKDKYRVVYTDHQRVELEKEFYYSRYITIRRKTELAATLGLSERQVKIWFQNRRAKERKQVKKREELTQRESMVGLGDHPHQLGPHQHHLGQDLLSPASAVIM